MEIAVICPAWFSLVYSCPAQDSVQLFCRSGSSVGNCHWRGCGDFSRLRASSTSLRKIACAAVAGFIPGRLPLGRPIFCRQNCLNTLILSFLPAVSAPCGCAGVCICASAAHSALRALWRRAALFKTPYCPKLKQAPQYSEFWVRRERRLRGRPSCDGDKIDAGALSRTGRR